MGTEVLFVQTRKKGYFRRIMEILYCHRDGCCTLLVPPNVYRYCWLSALKFIVKNGAVASQKKIRVD
jgi:hypothetical protein